MNHDHEKIVELVIKLPEEIRIALINNSRLYLGQRRSCDSCIKEAIINGIEIPKDHGKLIDVDAIELKGFLSQDDAHLVTIDRVKEALNNVPTIIEKEVIK